MAKIFTMVMGADNEAFVYGKEGKKVEINGNILVHYCVANNFANALFAFCVEQRELLQALNPDTIIQVIGHTTKRILDDRPLAKYVTVEYVLNQA